MIVKATFRGAGGLGSHLSNVQKNERVIVREDLCVGCLPDIKETVATFAAMGQATGIERSIVHIAVSPAAKIPTDGGAIIVETVRRGYEIDAEHPLLVVAHDKNSAAGREQHFHIVLPRKNPSTGESISDSWSYRKDELIGRLLEDHFDHPIVSGRFNKSIAQELEVSHPELATKLLALDQPTRGSTVGQATTQQADRLKIHQKSFDDDVYRAWKLSDGDFRAFALNLDQVGASIARGDRALLVVDDATGYSAPLVRLLRRKAKAAGAQVSLHEADFADAFSAAKDFGATRDEGLARAKSLVDAAIERECVKGLMESLADGDESEAADFRKERERRRDEAKTAAIRVANEKTLQAQREAIWAAFREKDRLRRKRVDRAFRAAKLARTPAFEKIAFALAAGTALLTGMSLGMALGLIVWSVAAAKIARANARLHESPRAAIAATKTEREADLKKTRAEGSEVIRNRPHVSRNAGSRGSGIED